MRTKITFGERRAHVYWWICPSSHKEKHEAAGSWSVQKCVLSSDIRSNDSFFLQPFFVNLRGHLSAPSFPFRGARNGAPSRSAPSKVRHSSREVELMDLFVNCVSNAHDLGPFAVLFSTTAAAPRIYPSTADKLLPGSRFEMRQMFATSPVVVFNLSRRGGDGDGGKMLLLSAWNTAMHESNATCTVQQQSHPMINLPRSERIGPWWKSSIFFFWRSRIYQNKPQTSLWEGAIARRWCKYGLGGCFRFSVV